MRQLKKIVNKSLVVVIFMLLASNLYPHDKVDSLQRLLNSERNDTARLTLLNEIAWELKVSDPAKAIRLIDSVINLSKTRNIPVCLAEAYNHLGIIYANAGDYKSATEWIVKGNNISHEIEDSIGIAKAMNNLAIVYWSQNALDKSLEYIEIAIKIYKKIGRRDYLAMTYNNLGMIYRDKKDFSKAVQCYHLAIRNLDDFPDDEILINAKLNLAETYLLQKRTKDAIQAIKDCETLYKQANTQKDLSALYLIKGKYFEQVNEWENAEKYYLESLQVSRELKSFKVREDVLKILSHFYQNNNNYKKAYDFEKKYHHLKDSLNSIQNYLLLSRIEIQEEFDEKLTKQTKYSEIKEQIQQAEIDYQKKIRNYLIIGFFILSILGVFTLLNFKQRLKNTRILANQRKEILLKTEILREQMEKDKEKTELLEIINEENEILSLVAKETNNTVFILSPDGNIEWVNEAFHRLSGYGFEEFKRLRGTNILQASASELISENFKICLETKKPVSYVSKTKAKDKKSIWIHTTLTPVLDENKKVTRLIAIDADITKIKEVEEQIAVKNKEITWSLQYARKIQKALLPMAVYMKAIFPEHLIINLPQHIVSGDFYWVVNKNEQILAVVADSTGHGVPGAFMSILGISSLQEIVSKMDVLEPSKILEQLRSKIVYSLNYQGDDSLVVNSLDIAVCVVDTESKMLSYAGSNNPVYIIRDEVLVELKPDKYFLWNPEPDMPTFSLKTFQLLEDDRVYMFTDGFSDQFGGDADKKYSRRRFKKLLLDIYTLPMDTQKDLLRMELKSWQGNNEQIDDILIFAFQA